MNERDLSATRRARLHQEFRRGVLVEQMNQTPNLTNGELAAQTGVSLATVERDLSKSHTGASRGSAQNLQRGEEAK